MLANLAKMLGAPVVVFGYLGFELLIMLQHSFICVYISAKM